MPKTNFYKNKKILVAGAAGFLGANLIKGLLSRGAKIRGTLHKKPAAITDSRIEYVFADLQTPEDCAKAVNGIDFVFMCAANTSGAAVIQNKPLSHVTPNIIMNTLMLEAAYNAKVKKYLWLSSNIVYPPANHPVKESEMMSGPPFDKYFPAGWTKRFGEILCEMYSTKIKQPMTAIVVRPANMYGPFDDFEWETSHVVPALIRKAVERHNPIEVWGDGSDVKDLIYIDDFIKGILLAMEKINDFDIINIGTGIPVTVKDVLKTILEADNYLNAEIAFNPSKPTMIPFRLLDVSKAEKELGFTAKTNLAKGIKKTVEWLKSSRPKSN